MTRQILGRNLPGFGTKMYQRIDTDNYLRTFIYFRDLKVD